MSPKIAHFGCFLAGFPFIFYVKLFEVFANNVTMVTHNRAACIDI